MYRTLFKSIAVYLVVATFFMTLPAQGWAMFIPSTGAALPRNAELSSIQRTLESAMIRQRLADFSLSSEEVMARMNALSDEQVHQFAANLDSLQAGADGVDGLIFLLLVVLLVIVFLEASGRHVIIR